jgi:hypothetical protein
VTVRHILLFRFREEVTPEQVEASKTAWRRCPG